MPEKTNYKIADQQIKYLTQKEVKSLFSQIQDKRDKALFATIYRYGLRVSEATLLTLDSINWDDNRIYIRRVKNGISTERRLYDDVRRAIKAYLRVRQETGTALFTGREGDLKPNTIAKLFKKYARQAKLDNKASIHSLRHSCGVHSLEAGLDVREVQDLLGHRNIQNTMIYTQISDKKRERVDKRLEESPDIVKI
ncbi:MAG: tyrosine-type recombinase/integrase [Candidatus Poribacteria bacterium]